MKEANDPLAEKKKMLVDANRLEIVVVVFVHDVPVRFVNQPAEFKRI